MIYGPSKMSLPFRVLGEAHYVFFCRILLIHDFEHLRNPVFKRPGMLVGYLLLVAACMPGHQAFRSFAAIGVASAGGALIGFQTLV